MKSTPITRIAPLVSVPVTGRQRRAVERIDAEDYSPVIGLVRREARAHGQPVPTDQEASEAIVALKQYYALSVLDGRNMHALAAELDPYWHAHVLDTVAYGCLCEDIGCFMHHDPLDRGDTVKAAAVDGLYRSTVETLEHLFGAGNVSPVFYPRRHDVVAVCLHDLDLTRDYLLESLPERPGNAEARARYGHTAARNRIRQALAA